MRISAPGSHLGNQIERMIAACQRLSEGLPEDGSSTPLQPIRIPLWLTYTHYKTPGKGILH